MQDASHGQASTLAAPAPGPLSRSPHASIQEEFEALKAANHPPHTYNILYYEKLENSLQIRPEVLGPILRQIQEDETIPDDNTVEDDNLEKRIYDFILKELLSKDPKFAEAWKFNTDIFCIDSLVILAMARFVGRYLESYDHSLGSKEQKHK
ncbi:hypothetical protein AA313_de0200877 [Arthrobotrys entomopaga]|nr:hypothetical protein AA313_de0200877 [Arthrobotrys entomopaga]